MDVDEEVNDYVSKKIDYVGEVLPKDLARIVQKNTAIWFYKYEDLFLNNSLELCDLEVEGCMEASKVLKSGRYNHLPADQLRKIIKTAVNRKMNKLFKKYQKMEAIVIHVPNYTQDTDGEMTDEEYLQTKSINPFTINLNVTIFDDLKNICTKEECDLIHKKFVEGKSLREIGAEYQLSDGRVSQMLNELLGKLRDKMERP